MKRIALVLLVLSAAPATAQRVPPEALETLLAHVHRDQGATALVLDRESLTQTLDTDIAATEGLRERLTARGIPARWCEQPCSSAPGEREVTLVRVPVSEPDMVQVELDLFGRHPPRPDGGRITAWLERHEIRLTRELGIWTVSSDHVAYVRDYGIRPRGVP